MVPARTVPALTGPGQRALAEPMASRWSASVFDDGPAGEVSDDELALALAAAAWSPSFGNTQPWGFVVLRRGTGAHGSLLETLNRGNRTWVPRVPVVLVAAHQSARAPGDEKDPPPLAAYDLGQAAAHLTLQATAQGLATHQFAGFDRERLADLLGVPPWFRVLAGIALGRHGDPAAADPDLAAREDRHRSRRPLAERVHLGTWGRPWPDGA